MNNVIRGIKQAFNQYKKDNPSETIDDATPFVGGQLWMNYYLFPELLIIYDEWAKDAPELKTYEELLSQLKKELAEFKNRGLK